VELQQVLPRLKAVGIALFAVSYDPVTVLSAFADKHDIAYPLLSDEGSHVMRRLGLINERVQEDHAAYGIKPDPRHANLPYPGVFALDGTGVIVGRRFHESYRERDGGATLLAKLLGLPDPPSNAAPAAGNDSVRVRAWLDAPTYRLFQRLHLNVEVSISPGLHLTAPPLVHVAAMPGVEVGPAEWQSPSTGVQSARGVVPLTFAAAPGAGDVIVDATVTCQPMRDGTRLPPVAAHVRTSITERAMVDRTLPAPQPSSAKDL
jgi:AhpC/TSA family